MKTPASLTRCSAAKASDGERAKNWPLCLHNLDADATDLAKGFLVQVTKPMLMADMGISNVGFTVCAGWAAIGIPRYLNPIERSSSDSRYKYFKRRDERG